MIVYCMLSVVSASAATFVVAVRVPVAASDLAVLVTLTALGVVQAELGRQVERARRRIAGIVHINMTSVWLLPAALLLPPVLVAVLVATLYWHLHLRSWYRLKRVSAFRTVINIAVTILTCYLTRAVAAVMGIDDLRVATQTGWTGLAAIALCIATYFIVNALLVIPGLNKSEHGIQTMLGGWGDNLLELATLCLGAILALALAALPAVAVLVIPPLFLLHRAVLIDQLESAARQDDKTGVWNAAGWHRIARHELSRNGATVGVLMVDLDHFKRINDTYGHLAGDAVLKGVADTITSTVRHRDSVGRFGGEEFVVLLPGLTPADVHAIAERIRAAISQLKVVYEEVKIGGLSASIGIATAPVAGTAIEGLIQVADAAMYRAKANGRDQVVSFADSPSASQGPH